ncbi:hypothetical protein QYE76_017197 [Lolium multiflorum]|uniref:CCHC-type domain-containing protein n=1 Tax=Lolium multiflorum TaxID=4521 RepID=A0AAD8QHI5_LOLMU|nr:hypothetical protein QYE76_017197 [Lolium multiflorum]
MEEDSNHHQASSEESVRPHQRHNNDDQDEGHGRPPPPQQQRNNNEDAQGPQPQPQQRQAHGEERPPPRRNDRNEEEIFGKLKFTMPKFQGEEDPDAYLSWVLKVDKIFRIHNFSEAKKVAMASLEFEGYANVWWEEVNKKREKEDLAPIDTWEEMQEVMHTRFVPTHHKRDLFNKLTQLKQSYKSVEEYYKEMHMTMMSANVDEREEQTMARFLNGLNIPVKRIVEFLPYKNMVELLHQATRAERQVREDLASAKTKTFFAARNAMNASSSIKNTSTLASKDPPKQARSAIKTTSFKPEQSTMSSKASTGSSNITCFKCGAQGHKSFECKNTRVMITRDDGDVEYLSEGEYEALVQAATSHEDDALEDQEQVLCVHDASPSLVVTKVLTTHALPNEDQRCNIFQTRAGINGKSIKVIIDGGSCHNLASTELCTKLNLPLRKHPHPYHVQWLSDNGNVKIQHTVTISFKIGAYEDTVDCDVVPMTVCHMLLGRPWQYDKKANHDGYTNAYSFKVNDKTYILRPMTPSQVIADNAKALARAKEATITSELRGERVIHQKESERHKPYVSEMKSVLLATKSEMREVHHNPSTTLHYVLICKGPSEETNDLTNIPSSLLSLLKEFQDVFPDELPHGLPPLRGIEHRIDLIPGAPLPNRAAYRTNPEDTKEIQRQIQDLLAKGYVRESLSPCAVPVILVPKPDETQRMCTSVKTQAMESKPMERELEMMKMELQRTGRNFRPPGPELPPPRTGTSALQDRNFRPDAAKMPSSAQRSGTSRNFRPEGPELPPTRNFRPSSAQVPKVRQNAPGCYCKEMGLFRNLTGTWPELPAGPELPPSRAGTSAPDRNFRPMCAISDTFRNINYDDGTPRIQAVHLTPSTIASSSSSATVIKWSGDETRDGEVLRNTERLATQHNLWIQRQEFKEQLSLFETRIDEQYEEVAHNFSTVNQDLALLREATDNLNGQMAANDANMERRMDNLERAITNLGPPPQGMKTILVLIDHMLVKKTLALTQGEVNSIAMLVLMNDLHKNKLLTKIVIKRLAMPTMGMTTIPKTTSTTTWRHMVMLPPKVVKSNQGVISGIILAMTKGAEGNHNMIKMREP